jgi:hypothetical protein
LPPIAGCMEWNSIHPGGAAAVELIESGMNSLSVDLRQVARSTVSQHAC